MAFEDKGALKDKANALDIRKLSVPRAHFYALPCQGRHSCPEKQAAGHGYHRLLHKLASRMTAEIL